MVIRPKDASKLFGVIIMCACATLICTLFLNSNIDMTRIKDQITDPEAMVLYDLTLSSGNVTSAVTGCALALTTVVMLLFYVKHYIDIHKPELGILKALGYSNFKIAKSFWVFGLSVFTGTAAGFGLAFAFMPAFYEQMRNNDTLPNPPLHFNPMLVVCLVLLPALAFSLLAILYSYRKLNRPVLELIRGKSNIPIRKAKRKNNQDSGTDFLQDLKRSTVQSRFSLVFFIALSAFCYAAMTQMSLGVQEISSTMMAVMMAGIGFILALTTLFLAVTTVIKANGKTIAMLRVFGYSDRECGGAILNGYRPAAYIGFALGSTYQYGLMQMMLHMFFDNSTMGGVPEMGFDVPAFIISLISYILVYEIIMFVYTARIKRIPLKEVMQEE
jgi:putative ABC transport system permease protein